MQITPLLHSLTLLEKRVCLNDVVDGKSTQTDDKNDNYVTLLRDVAYLKCNTCISVINILCRLFSVYYILTS